MIARVLLAGAAMLLGSAQQLPQQLDRPAPRLVRIEMKTTIRGRLVSSWTIDAKGNGRLTVPEPDVNNATRFVTRGFAAGTAGFRDIRVTMGLAEYRAGPVRQLPCLNRVYDAEYGDLRWTQPGGRVSRLAVDFGCLDHGTHDVLEQLKRADSRIARWAAAGPVVESVPAGRQ